MLYLFIVVEQVSTITILSSSLTDGPNVTPVSVPAPMPVPVVSAPMPVPVLSVSAPMPVPVLSGSAPVSVVSSPVPVLSAPVSFVSSWSPSNFGSDDDDVFEPPLLPPSVKPRTLYTSTSNTDQGRFYFTLT